MDIRVLSIDSTELSKRSQNALHRAGIHTVGDMLELSEESLIGIRNLGKKSIEEILTKIEEYSKAGGSERLLKADKETVDPPKDFDEWIKEDDGKEFVLSWLQKVKIDALELLPARAYNLLVFNGYDNMAQVTFLTEEDLMRIPHMDTASAREILRLCSRYLQDMARSRSISRTTTRRSCSSTIRTTTRRFPFGLSSWYCRKTRYKRQHTGGRKDEFQNRQRRIGRVYRQR